MPRYAALVPVSFIILLGCGQPAAAQSGPGCYPHCDFTHYYGPYNYGYVQPGLICYPRCRPDGVCAPDPLCISQQPRGRVTVRSLAGTVTTTSTTSTFYDPSVTVYPPRRRR
jgi:hypothetical protein